MFPSGSRKTLSRGFRNSKMAKLQSILEVLKPIPPDDMRFILQGYRGSEASQADAKTHVRVWELLCLENKTPLEIAKIFKVTRTNIDNKIERIVELVQRNPIMIDKLPPDTDIFQFPLERLFLSERTYRRLKDADVQTIGDLARRGEQDLLKIKNLGRKSLNEIKTVLWKIMSRFKSVPLLQQEIKKLKARSQESSTGSTEWSGQDHEQLLWVLAQQNNKFTEATGLVELVLKSVSRHGRHVQEGFVIPYRMCLFRSFRTLDPEYSEPLYRIAKLDFKIIRLAFGLRQA